MLVPAQISLDESMTQKCFVLQTCVHGIGVEVCEGGEGCAVVSCPTALLISLRNHALLDRIG